MSSPQVHLRRATIEDAPDIRALSAQLGYPDPSSRTVGRLEVILGEKDHAVLVACLADESVVGWIHVFVAHRLESDAFAELGGFVVAENQRGHGIGRLLLPAAEKWVLDQGLGKLRGGCEPSVSQGLDPGPIFRRPATATGRCRDHVDSPRPRNRPVGKSIRLQSRRTHESSQLQIHRQEQATRTAWSFSPRMTSRRPTVRLEGSGYPMGRRVPECREHLQ